MFRVRVKVSTPMIGSAKVLLAAGITAFSLVMATGVSATTYENVLFGALAVVAAAAMLLGLLRWPQAGIAFMVIAGLMVPDSVQAAMPSRLNVSLLLAPAVIGAWLLWMMRREREASWEARPALHALMFLLTCCGFSLIAGQFPWFPAAAAPWRAQLGGLAIFLFSGGIFAASAYLLRDLKWLRRITWLFLFLAALRVALLLAPPMAKFQTGALFQGTLGSMFWTWLIALAVSQAFFNRNLSFAWRLALFLLSAASVYITLFMWREWASGWLPGLVAIAVIVFLHKPWFAMVLAAGATPFVIWQFSLIRQALWSGDQAFSLLTRVEAMNVLARIAQVNPILGFGPANYYHYTPMYPILGWYVQFSSHNNYIDLVLQTGVAGLIAFLCFAVLLWRSSMRLRKLTRDGFSTAYVYGSIGGLAGTLFAMALGDWVLPFAYNVGLRGFPISILAWIFLGGVAALSAVITADSRRAGKRELAEQPGGPAPVEPGALAIHARSATGTVAGV